MAGGNEFFHLRGQQCSQILARLQALLIWPASGQEEEGWLPSLKALAARNLDEGTRVTGIDQHALVTANFSQRPVEFRVADDTPEVRRARSLRPGEEVTARNHSAPFF